MLVGCCQVHNRPTFILSRCSMASSGLPKKMQGRTWTAGSLQASPQHLAELMVINHTKGWVFLCYLIQELLLGAGFGAKLEGCSPLVANFWEYSVSAAGTGRTEPAMSLGHGCCINKTLKYISDCFYCVFSPRWNQNVVIALTFCLHDSV